MTKSPKSPKAKTANVRPLFGNRRKRKYNYTSAASSAAYEKRELLEKIRPTFQRVGPGNCFPYRNGYQWPKEAMDLLQAGFTPRHCGNGHICPVCASRYMSVRRAQFEVAAEAWVSKGGYMMQLKLSLRNDPSVPSRDKYIGLAKTWTRLRNKSRYVALADSVGDPHFVKILEEVITPSGLFPHLHVIWLFDKEVMKKSARYFLQEVMRLWCEAANAYSLGAEIAGQRLGRLSNDNVPGIAFYFFKHGYYDLNLKPQNHDKLDPFEAYRRFQITGEIEYLVFWVDFQAASEGQIRVKFSSNFPFIATSNQGNRNFQPRSTVRPH